ncbi:hypothetical protein MMC30_005279 [Trapelia coarctata]|nr:hypothetical protein [Trapelia coarctata]
MEITTRKGEGDGKKDEKKEENGMQGGGKTGKRKKERKGEAKQKEGDTAKRRDGEMGFMDPLKFDDPELDHLEDALPGSLRNQSEENFAVRRGLACFRNMAVCLQDGLSDRHRRDVFVMGERLLM